MLTRKQIHYLRAKAHTLKPVFQIGKAGLHEPVFSELDAVLESRELIKITLLQNTDEDPHQAGARIAEETHAELVQVIGRTLIFYRRSQETMKIELPRG
ncbi:MAG: ribosome assembly RNA-binding protein YhbY [Sporolactobacillus sp.]